MVAGRRLEFSKCSISPSAQTFWLTEQTRKKKEFIHNQLIHDSRSRQSSAPGIPGHGNSRDSRPFFCPEDPGIFWRESRENFDIDKQRLWAFLIRKSKDFERFQKYFSAVLIRYILNCKYDILIHTYVKCCKRYTTLIDADNF